MIARLRRNSIWEFVAAVVLGAVSGTVGTSDRGWVKGRGDVTLVEDFSRATRHRKKTFLPYLQLYSTPLPC